MFSEQIKQESEDERSDFAEKKKGEKRKRIKEEPIESPTHSPK